MNNILQESYNLSPIKDKHSISKMYKILTIKDSFKRDNKILTEQINQIMELIENENDILLTESEPDFYTDDDYIVNRHIAKGIGSKTLKGLKILLNKTQNALEWVAYQIFGNREVAKAIAYTGSYFIIGMATLGMVDKVVEINNKIMDSIFNFANNITTLVARLIKIGKLPLLLIKGAFKDMFGDGGYDERAEMIDIVHSLSKANRNIEFKAKNLIKGRNISETEKNDLAKDIAKVQTIVNSAKKHAQSNKEIIEYLTNLQRNKDIMYKGIVTKLKNRDKSELAKKVNEERLEAIKLIENAKHSIKNKISEDK